MDRDTVYSLLEKANLQKVHATGEGFQAMCPFHHSASGQASWKINVETGLWLCWKPSCAQSGNMVSFLTRLLGLPYKQALQYIDNIPVLGKLQADQWRLPDYDQRHVVEEKVRPERQLGLYAMCPKYMLQRGFSKRFLYEFDIGYDREARRVTFPIRRIDGRLVGFTRRATLPNQEPKYLHDIEGGTMGQNLYLAELVQPGSPLGMTEGSVDALMSRFRARQALGLGLDRQFLQAMHNMTAVMGSGCTEEQALLAAHLDPPFVLCGFDCWKWNGEEYMPDEGGLAATRRTIRNLRKIGMTDIRVAVWPPVFGDLGEVDRKHLPEINCVSSLDWLRQR